MRDNKENAELIDKYLRGIYNASFAATISDILESRPIPSQANKEKFRSLEFIMEDLDLVIFVKGRDNSTLGGQCMYFISDKGRELVEGKISSLTLIENSAVHSFSEDLFSEDEEGWNTYIETIINKRASEADKYIDYIVAEKIIELDRETLKKHFIQWFKETKEVDLQIKDGDLAIEDNDFQLLPSFEEVHIADFIKWFEKNKSDFVKYLKSQKVKTDSKDIFWTKRNIVITVILGIIGVAATIWAAN